MAAGDILGLLAVVFLVLGGLRAVREGRVGPAARTWLMIGVIFGVVSAWTWLTGPH
jgi:drug/metabolite transporter (DMT)-like permease